MFLESAAPRERGRGHARRRGGGRAGGTAAEARVLQGGRRASGRAVQGADLRAEGFVARWRGGRLGALPAGAPRAWWTVPLRLTEDRRLARATGRVDDRARPYGREGADARPLPGRVRATSSGTAFASSTRSTATRRRPSCSSPPRRSRTRGSGRRRCPTSLATSASSRSTRAGNGRSDRPDTAEAYSYWEYVEDGRAVLDGDRDRRRRSSAGSATAAAGRSCSRATQPASVLGVAAIAPCVPVAHAVRIRTTGATRPTCRSTPTRAGRSATCTTGVATTAASSSSSSRSSSRSRTRRSRSRTACAGASREARRRSCSPTRRRRRPGTSEDDARELSAGCVVRCSSSTATSTRARRASAPPPWRS